MTFEQFIQAISDHFASMQAHTLYRTDVEKELLWMTYLESFPPGTNPVFRERTEHDCQHCKSFIRAVGSMIAVIDGAWVSVWDAELEGTYATVARALSELVKSAPIRNVLLHDKRVIGQPKTYEAARGGKVLAWEHLSVKLPEVCVCGDRGSVYADKASARDVFKRGLEEISANAVGVVIELIEQGSLYRGEESLGLVERFGELRDEYESIEDERTQDAFVWRQDLSPAMLRVRNSAIGTLLVDLSSNMELDAAVRLFESKVAPANYKRPKAVVSKSMIARARQSVEDLGFGSALGRRFAVAEDINIVDILFANRDARRAMNADVFDELMSEATVSTRSLDRVEEVGIEDFIERILARANSVEVLFENRHVQNLVNLVAPRSPDAKHMFKWPNNFSWAYAGDLADSIKTRVKARGGRVTGDFRASLAWFNKDDLDLHLVEPNGTHIHFGHKRSKRTGGELDVDMNVGDSGPRSSRNAVENIAYRSRAKMLEGEYHLYVHNYTHRERRDPGFEVEMEFGGETMSFAYEREVRPKQSVTVAKFTYSHERGLSFGETLPRRDAAKTLWGLSTQSFHPVTMAMLSPNHWGERPTGNKHYFFMLQDCEREGSSRGFFNEYLHDDLREHRKVFELLGAKMRTAEDGAQLSGLGFSSTRRNHIYCKVSGAFSRTVKVLL